MKFKRKKVHKYRATKTHGCGSMKKRRGAGHRGGRGRAGSGKKADQKKPMYAGEPIGKHGFTSKNRKFIVGVNITDVEHDLPSLLEQEIAVKKEGGFAVDLTKTVYNKLLGSGKPSQKLFITVDFASKNAIERVKAAGGEVTVLKTIVKKKKAASHKKKAAAAGESDAPDSE
ncbi:uL15 family ribosomal protein [Candidatus Woesearchaeota archaeon]|nr:uL15 family ribosomal protein [Candidatus Woesearchaeota archaeon]